MTRTAWSLLALPLMVWIVACSSTRNREEELLRELADLDKQTIFERAEAMFAEEKYADARRFYSFVYDTFPNDPLGHKAALRIADTYAVKKDSASLMEARLRFRDFANRYPNDPDRDYALFMVGQTFAKRNLKPDRDLAPIHEAVSAYQQLINLYPSSPYVDEAQQRIGELRETLAEHELLVAQFYTRNRRWRGAMWRLEYLKANYPDYSRMDEVDTMLERAREAVASFETRHQPVDQDGGGASAPTSQEPDR